MTTVSHYMQQRFLFELTPLAIGSMVTNHGAEEPLAGLPLRIEREAELAEILEWAKSYSGAVANTEEREFLEGQIAAGQLFLYEVTPVVSA